MQLINQISKYIFFPENWLCSEFLCGQQEGIYKMWKTKNIPRFILFKIKKIQKSDKKLRKHIGSNKSVQ